MDGYTYAPLFDQCADGPLSPFPLPMFAIWSLDIAPTPLPECNDAIDNDGDGTIDWNGTATLALDVGCFDDPSEDEAKDAEPHTVACEACCET